MSCNVYISIGEVVLRKAITVTRISIELLDLELTAVFSEI